MNDADAARQMLAMARKDFRALQAMIDPEVFAEEVFGFHAQQSAEKIIKAWLSLLGQQYPRTHDLSLLLHLLSKCGVDCSSHHDLIEYNAYAVQYRYEAFDAWEAPIDRAVALGRVARLLEIVEKLAGANEESKQ